jgi:hypothetical protein
MGDARIEAAARVSLLFGLDPIDVLAADRVTWAIRAACARVAAEELAAERRRQAKAVGR